MNDGLGDSRIRLVTRIVKDMPPTALGAPAHRAGSIASQTSLVQTRSQELVSFTTPSVSAMALRVAIDAAETAIDLKSGVSFRLVISPFGDVDSIGPEQTSEFFDFLQSSMVCTVFSYLAVEVYCNEIISNHPNELVRVKLTQRDSVKEIQKPAKSLERLSTEDKLDIVLPQLLGITTPKGIHTWRDFKTLQRARNDTVHVKPEETNPKVKNKNKIDRESLFYRFLSEADLHTYPKAAVNVILHFTPKDDVPRWLREPIARLDIT